MGASSGGMREVGGSSQVTGQMTVLDLHYTITRGSVVRFFSIFVVILMWLLSSFELAMAVDHVVVRPRQVLSPTIGFGVSMMFALPAVRSTQPGIPGMGCLVDVAGFFWNMAMISCGSAAAAAVSLCWAVPAPASSRKQQQGMTGPGSVMA